MGEEESTSEATTTIHPDDIETGPSLGQILGVMTLVIIVFYIFGITWKVNKMQEHNKNFNKLNQRSSKYVSGV